MIYYYISGAAPDCRDSMAEGDADPGIWESDPSPGRRLEPSEIGVAVGACETMKEQWGKEVFSNKKRCSDRYGHVPWMQEWDEVGIIGRDWKKHKWISLRLVEL